MTEQRKRTTHGDRVQVSVLLGPRDRKRLEVIARREGRSLTNLGSRMIAAALDAYEPQTAISQEDTMA